MGAMPPGYPLLTPGGPSLSRRGLTVCVSVCVRIEGAGVGERAEAGLGPRRSACRQRLHRHGPGQPVCAEPICVGDPDAGVD